MRTEFFYFSENVCNTTIVPYAWKGNTKIKADLYGRAACSVSEKQTNILQNIHI